ncbi:MAG: hypothetical protein H7267_08965 [Sandarakinorhabdus sp.]|nr:hypothetical protein [Sandarakinorhabdus sp.]
MLTACLAAPLAALSNEPAKGAAGETPPAAAASAPSPAQLEARHVDGLGQPATGGELERLRGGDGGSASSATLDGVVSGNSATNVITGGNAIVAGSFAGATGIPIVIQNSGANVLIQNATIINLQFK